MFHMSHFFNLQKDSPQQSCEVGFFCSHSLVLFLFFCILKEAVCLKVSEQTRKLRIDGGGLSSQLISLNTCVGLFLSIVYILDFLICSANNWGGKGGKKRKKKKGNTSWNKNCFPSWMCRLYEGGFWCCLVYFKKAEGNQGENCTSQFQYICLCVYKCTMYFWNLLYLGKSC